MPYAWCGDSDYSLLLNPRSRLVQLGKSEMPACSRQSGAAVQKAAVMWSVPQEREARLWQFSPGGAPVSWLTLWLGWGEEPHLPSAIFIHTETELSSAPVAYRGKRTGWDSSTPGTHSARCYLCTAWSLYERSLCC